VIARSQTAGAGAGSREDCSTSTVIGGI